MPPETDKPRLIGINHVAIEVGDHDAAIDFYESIFNFEVRGRTDTTVFIDMGDQFLPLVETETAGTGSQHHRHIGIVVDDTTAVRERLTAAGIDLLEGPGLEFRDPWENRLQIVAYEEIQFTKAEHVLAGMGCADLDKTATAIAELAEKGMAPE